MRTVSARQPLRAQCALAWGLLCFVGLQLAVAVVADRWKPELRDPEYGYRLASLRSWLKFRPGQPLLVGLGSSRIAQGFAAQLVGGRRGGSEPRPIAFNLGITSAGPLTELLCLKRLLAQGIRPRWVVVEVMPSMLDQELDCLREDQRLRASRLDWDDVRLVARYADRPGRVYGSWFYCQLTAAFTHRLCILTRYAPDWLSPYSTVRAFRQTLDEWGWFPHCIFSADAETYRRGIEHSRGEYQPILQNLALSDISKREMQDLLTTCRREGITAVLVLMPESSDFRSWYVPQRLAEVEMYLGELSRAYGVPVVDARGWIADRYLYDGHHMTVTGATLFTQRLDRQVLRPLLAGKPLPSTFELASPEQLAQQGI